MIYVSLFDLNNNNNKENQQNKVRVKQFAVLINYAHIYLFTYILHTYTYAHNMYKIVS